MHRFRRKSDARPQTSPSVATVEPLPDPFQPPRLQQFQPLPALPSEKEFRTSLILPSLSQRFTLLRATNGDPISLEDMRSRFAGQRAKGAEYQISEHEEQLILDQLSNIRTANARSSALSRRPSDLQSNDESSVYPESDYTNSRSPPTSPSLNPQHSPPSSISRRQKRHSNNLFSSPQMRDASYLRAQRHGSGKSPVAELNDDSNRTRWSPNRDDHIVNEYENDQVETKEDVTSDYSTDKTPTPSRMKLKPMHSHTSSSSSEHRVNQFKRISLALSSVMREIEEEGVLPPEEGTPRSAPLLGSFSSFLSENKDQNQPDESFNTQVQSHVNGVEHVVSEGAKLSRSPSNYSRAGNISPSPRIHGYIPGMPRPVTPRDYGIEDEHRPRSTTPRASSPSATELFTKPPVTIPQSILRRGGSLSAHNRALPRSDSPVYSPPSSSQGRTISSSAILTKSASLHERRRPASPLNTLAKQTSILGQLPRISSDGEPNSPASGSHSRQGSLTGMPDHYLGFHNRSNSVARFASPALPDSPLLDSAHTSMINYIHPPQVDAIDIGSPMSSASFTRSPSSPFSFGRSPSMNTSPDIDPNHRRSPKPYYGNGHSSYQSPYTKSLALSPILNSSQSSLQSTGSSYHSTADSSRKTSDAAFSIIRDSGSTDATSPDVTSDDQNVDGASDPKKVLEDALNFFGLSQEHFVNIQEQLLQAAPPDLVLTPRTPTLRRRNNSINSRALGASNGISASPPQLDSPVAEDAHLRANALLDSVLNSIESSIIPSSPKAMAPEDPKLPSRSSSPASPPSPDTLPEPMLELESDTPPEPEVQGEESNLTSSYVDTSSGLRSTSALQSLADALFGSSILDDVEKPQLSDPSDSFVGDSVSSYKPEVANENDMSPDDEVEILQEQNINFRSSDRLAGEGYDEFEPSNGFVPRSSPHLRPPTTPVRPSPRPSPSPTIPTSSDASTPDYDSRAGSSLAQSPGSQQQLILDVSRKAAEATAALKSPSQANLGELPPTPRRRPGRRIDPDQISSPHLVSSSSKMNTWTIYSPSNSNSQVALSPPSSDVKEVRSPSKISKGMQKLRGTWKGNKVLTGDEIMPWTHDSSSRTSIDQSREMYASFSSHNSNHSPEREYGESNRGQNQSNEPSPPATAGPSLKSFLGRFRRNRRDTETGDSQQRSQLSARTTDGPGQMLQRNHSVGATGLLNYDSANDSSSALATHNSRPVHVHQTSAPAFIQTFSASHTSLNSPPRAITPDVRHDPIPENEEVRKLFEAASNLGLDQGELTQLLSRSTSTSSKVGWGGQSPSLSRSPSGVTATNLPSFSQALESSLSSLERSKTPEVDRDVTIRRAKSGATRKGSLKRSLEQSRTRPELDDSTGGERTVIRRTLIFPSDGQFGDTPLSELEGLIRKASRRRRSIGANSVTSARSVQDRVPTPPPARHKRMSTDRSPPVPRIPAISIPGTPMASSTPTNASFPEHLPPPRFTRAYDSVYDMYGDLSEQSPGTPAREEALPSPAQMPGPESGPVIELLELSNGQTIWSIVNDLRSSAVDGDDASVFRRQSFSSEYSVSPTQSHEGGSSAVQLLFKEHKRMSSKSSANSYLASALRKKAAAAGARPETKVFYSSTQQIGRLIDSLSKGLESGSFNIVPVEGVSASTPGTAQMSFEPPHPKFREDGTVTPASQHSETSAQMTMEERVERMLNNLEAANAQSPFNTHDHD